MPSNLTTSLASNMPPMAPSTGSVGGMPPSYSAAMPYLHPSVPYLDLESDSSSTQAGSTYGYGY